MVKLPMLLKEVFLLLVWWVTVVLRENFKKVFLKII